VIVSVSCAELDLMNRTPLHYVAFGGGRATRDCSRWEATLHELLNCGADVDAVDNCNVTALMLAAFHGKKTIEQRLGGAADRTICDKLGRSVEDYRKRGAKRHRKHGKQPNGKQRKAKPQQPPQETLPQQTRELEEQPQQHPPGQHEHNENGTRARADQETNGVASPPATAHDGALSVDGGSSTSPPSSGSSPFLDAEIAAQLLQQHQQIAEQQQRIDYQQQRLAELEAIKLQWEALVVTHRAHVEQTAKQHESMQARCTELEAQLQREREQLVAKDVAAASERASLLSRCSELESQVQHERELRLSKEAEHSRDRDQLQSQLEAALQREHANESEHESLATCQRELEAISSAASAECGSLRLRCVELEAALVHEREQRQRHEQDEQLARRCAELEEQVHHEREVRLHKEAEAAQQRDDLQARCSKLEEQARLQRQLYLSKESELLSRVDASDKRREQAELECDELRRSQQQLEVRALFAHKEYELLEHVVAELQVTIGTPFSRSFLRLLIQSRTFYLLLTFHSDASRV